MRVCVLVIASYNKPEYLAMEKLWLQRIVPFWCDVWLLHSKPACEWVGDLVNDSWIDPQNVEVDMARRTIYFKQDECLIPGILAKTVKAIEFLFKSCDLETGFPYKYDFVWRTNLSSVLDFDGLHAYCSKGNFDSLSGNAVEPSVLSGFYGGYIGNYGDGRFASGAGFLMSRDVAEYLVLHKDSLRWDLIDDVAIGFLLEPVFGLVHIERQWIQSLDERIEGSTAREILINCNGGETSKTEVAVFHYRCESYMHLNTVAFMQKVIKSLD